MTGWRNVPDPGEEYPVVDKMLIIKLMNYPYSPPECPGAEYSISL